MAMRFSDTNNPANELDKTYDDKLAEKEKSYAKMNSDPADPIGSAKVLIKKLNESTTDYPPSKDFETLFEQLKEIEAKYPIYFSREYASTNSEVKRVEDYAKYLGFEESLGFNKPTNKP